MDAGVSPATGGLAPEVRVCPDCGVQAGSQPFCSSCGRNLSMIERLPTRGEWESGVGTTRPRPGEAAEAQEVATALGSIRTWYVPLGGSASAEDSALVELLKTSVRDHVADALEVGGRDPLPVEVDLSADGNNAAYLAASVVLPREQSVEIRFAASIQRGLAQAQVRPVGSISLVEGDGKVVRTLAEIAPTAEGRDNKGFLVGAYISAILLPVVGIVVALYTAVSERRSAVRRHAIAIGGIAILSAALYVVVITSIDHNSQDRNVAADLQNLLDSNLIQYSSIGGCAHQSGNQYVCTVTQNGQQIPVQVTDDGKTIYEQGISTNGQ